MIDVNTFMTGLVLLSETVAVVVLLAVAALEHRSASGRKRVQEHHLSILRRLHSGVVDIQAQIRDMP